MAKILKDWSEQELDFLQANYNTIGKHGCAKQLNRSTGCVRTKWYRLVKFGRLPRKPHPPGNFKKGQIAHNKKPPVILNCVVCKKEFSVQPFKAKLPYPHMPKYCSKSCQYKGIGTASSLVQKGKLRPHKQGQNASNWKGGVMAGHRSSDFIRKREIALKKYGNTCFSCGADGNVVRIVVHHIVPFRICKKHEVDNLIPLCIPCHMKIEHVTWKKYKLSSTGRFEKQEGGKDRS